MNCKDSTRIIIDQIISILNRLDDPCYQKPLEIFNGSSLGQHFRHILDFYNCILRGVESEHLDYSLRERELMVEQSSEYAAKIFRKMLNDVDHLSDNMDIMVYADFSENENTDRPLVRSTVGRELMYAYDHAIHHLAIIKIGIKADFPEISIHKNIGVAPSTIKHQSSKN